MPPVCTIAAQWKDHQNPPTRMESGLLSPALPSKGGEGEEPTAGTPFYKYFAPPEFFVTPAVIQME
jgi:hypothetical protein